MTPVRFIHTADWQLGLRAHFIPGNAGAVVRDARRKTVQKIGTIAREFKVDFVVVAGDVFEHHGLKPETIRRSFDRMRDIPAQVLLLPGNHDPLKGERPVVAHEQVCTFHWKQHEFTIETEDELAQLERFLDGYQGKDSTLIELTLIGALRMELRSRLDNEVLARARDRFRFLRVHDDKLHTVFGDEDVAALRASGWIGRVAERLQAGLPDKPNDDTARALRLLYRLHKEVS